MLRWFRKNNKIILFTGMILLMIAFLLQPVMSLFLPDPTKATVYDTPDGRLTVQDLQRADVELKVLADLGLGPIWPSRGDDNTRAWMLATRAAEDAGLYAGPSSVRMLKDSLGAQALVLGRIAARLKVTPEFIDAALAKFLAVEQYMALAEGAAFERQTGVDAPAGVRARARMNTFLTLYGFADPQWLHADRRVSPASMRALFQDQYASVDGAVAVIPAAAVPLAEEPSAEMLQGLFDAHRDQPEGVSEPYGFGYLQPARVRYEALRLDVDAVAAALRRTLRQHEIDAYLRGDGAEDPEAQEIVQASRVTEGEGFRVGPQARQDLVQHLAQLRAPDLAREMIRAVSLELEDDLRNVRRSNGYRITEGFTPAPLADVAERVAQRFAERMGDDRPIAFRFIDATGQASVLDDVAARVDFAGARLDNDRRLTLEQYLESLRELKAPGPFPATLRRSQAKVASPAMVVPSEEDGSAQAYLVLRVTKANPPVVPEALEEVREQVVNDARTQLRYEALADDAQTWVERAAETDLQDLVSASGPGAEFAWLEGSVQRSVVLAGEARPGALPLVGEDAALLDAIFARAQEIGVNVASADLTQRLVAYPSPDLKALVIFRLHDYDPLTRAAFAERAATGGALDASLLLEPRTPRDDRPRSLANLEARVGAVEPDAEEEAAEGEPSDAG